MSEKPSSAESEAAGTYRRLSAALLLGLAIVFLFAFQSSFSTPIDDAFISFRYLGNWLRGNGLVFNPGERVEGYSNFLWIAVLALPAALGVGPQLASVILDVALALGCLFLLLCAMHFATQRSALSTQHSRLWPVAAPLLFALSSGLIFWLGKGMEVIFYTFLQMAFAVAVLGGRDREIRRVRDGILVGVISAAAALTRPEGVVAPALVLAALAVAERDRRKPYILAFAVLAAAVAGQFAFRLLYYGPLWPNTYYAKRLPLGIALAGGFDYLRKFVVGLSDQEAWFYASGWASHLPIWVVCAAAWAFAAKQWRRLWPVALQMLALVAVAVYVGGDWMPAFRFFVPAIPLGCLLVAAGLSEMASESKLPSWRRILAPGLLAILVVGEVCGLVTMIRSHEFGRWRNHIDNYAPAARWLASNAKPGSLVALSDIGIISYYNPDLRFIDVLGLTDPHVASLPGIHYLKTDVDYVLGREPDYVIAMLFAWPEHKKVLPKTNFDEAFLVHVAAAKDYEKVGRLAGWREGMRGERYVLFEIYKKAAESPKKYVD
jgi:hypothetical protein